MEIPTLCIILHLIFVILIFADMECMDFQTFWVKQVLHARVHAIEESHILPYLQPSLLQMALFLLMPALLEMYNKIELSQPFGYFSI